VTVEDNVAPIAIANDITVQLDASGNVSITPEDVDQDASNDACGIQSLALDITSFDCTDVGQNTVTLTVTDNNNNVSTATAVVKVEDNVAPIAIANDITVQLDASGNVSITPSDIDQDASNDACGIQSLALDITSFDCTDVGQNTVTLTVTDTNNNVSTATAVVTVEDNVAPIAIANDITVQLDASGNVSITPEDVDQDASNDACGIQSLALDITSFDCTDVGQNTVTLTVTDNNNNVSTATAIVTVEDNVDPIAIANDITVQLDASGNVSITPSDIDQDASNDACGIQSLALDITSFDCTDVGQNTVTLTVTDNNNNVSTATAVVTVQDNVDPTVITQDITVQLDASGNATITPEMVDNGSNDNCAVASTPIQFVTTESLDYDCSNVGPNTVTLLVTDVNGNQSTQTAVVTVEDNVDPIALTQPLTVQLDDQGNGSITAQEVNNGSNDACGIASLVLDNTTFDCTDVGINTVTLTVTDNNGNSSTATAQITVEDNVAPIALTQDITVQLDDEGNASITPAMVDAGSADACGVTLSLDNSTFSCDNVGENTVTLIVEDPSGNTTTATAVITVEDNVAPIALAQDIVLNLRGNGRASITPEMIDNGSNDACGIASLALDITAFDCSNVGADNIVTLTVTDNNGNVSTATASVDVRDVTAPRIRPENVTVSLDENGHNQEALNGIVYLGFTSDACGIETIVASQYDFDCSHVGDNVVTLTVTDIHGNVREKTA
ncbi:unnamed protein product, partial [Discosporangium mesarthrocarpum]